jgi:hypothetical protein
MSGQIRFKEKQVEQRCMWARFDHIGDAFKSISMHHKAEKIVAYRERTLNSQCDRLL